jgi:D-alanyl-D-alanine carboxypeptidase/D-alanyl-D-alanine-endopeptidase (penicillin-binding protein 4)
MKTLLLYIAFFLLLIQSLSAQQNDSLYRRQASDSSVVGRSNMQILQSDLQALINNPDMSNAIIGVSVRSLSSGEQFFKYNDTKSFTPASNQKILTTATALKLLGKEFKYTTSAYLDGDLLQNGEYFGGIIIRGSGDPTMSNYFIKDPLEFVEMFASKLDSMGVRIIRGNIIGDDSYFDDVYYGPGWAWDDFLFPFCAQSNALSINDNMVSIRVQQGDTTGSPADIFVNPDCSYFRVINRIRTVGIGDLSEIVPFREPNSNIFELDGQIAFDTSGVNTIDLQVTIDNPTLYFLNILKETLEKHNIRFRGALLDIQDYNDEIDYMSLKPVFEYQSPNLSEIVKIINQQSHNLAADNLLRTIAKETTGVGSFANGSLQMIKFASSAGIPPDKIAIFDGSGLSRFNLFTPKYMVDLLAKIYKTEFRDVFMASLASPGQEGTLKRRMTQTLAEKRVKAKSGSMNNISTLSGYVTTRDNEILAFSIMTMNFTVPRTLAHNIEDLICMRLASFSRKSK